MSDEPKTSTPTLIHPDSDSPLETSQIKTIVSKHNTNVTLADRCRQIGRDTLAESLEECTVTQGLWGCSNCGGTVYRVKHCKQRLCAICGPRIAARHTARLYEIVRHAQEPKFITLTMPRVTDLADGIDFILRAFKRWRKFKQIDARIRGGAYKLEAKPKEDGWHVHIHLICDSLYIPHALLKSTWGRAIKHAEPSVDIRRLMGKQMIQDHTKYAAKTDAVADWTDAQLSEFLDAFHNRRTIQTFGTFFDAERDPELRDDYEPIIVCPHCGCEKSLYPIRAGPMIWGDAWQDVADAIIGDQPLTRMDPRLSAHVTPVSLPEEVSDEIDY